MRLTLIFPAIGRRPGQAYLRLWKMEPLSMGMLAALTPGEIEVKFYDDRLEPIPFDEPTDLVAMSVETYTARRAYQIASDYRKRRVPVVMGGFHPTLCPEEAARFADSVVQGEAEGCWSELLEDYRCGSPKRLYARAARPKLNGVVPKRDIFRGKRYLPLALVEAGRGCAMTCEFCAIQSAYRATYQHRPVEQVVAQIELLRRDRKSFFFVDDNLALDADYARELLRAITPLRIRWVGQMSLSAALDDDLVALLRRSGCAGVLIGFESLQSAALETMRKPFNLGPEFYRHAMANLRRQGIGVFGTFLFGYEQDTAETISEALDFAQREGFYLAAFNHLVPFPGTPVYQRLQREHRLRLARWWLDPHYRFNQLAFQPVKMHPEELRERCYAARRHFYSPLSTWRRHRLLRSHLTLAGKATYWALNLLHRAEVRHRDGFPLGDESWQGLLLEVN